ncbi:hypothetical protein EDD16DRAFT_1637541 [Pisolithus croceorrhizus]|nr:hypothetical protein EDD16DRAFT_1637541 [Pisolithus croceorrhizus]KAI6161310.1 hypothetical protein EDD17DRAFT_1589142 [Pisolithus thermaeus]
MIDAEKREILNKRLLAAARGSEDIVGLLTDPEYRDPDDDENFLFDINCKDVLGNTPLHLAVSNESVDDVDLILGAPLCDVDIQNNKGDTPLHLAVRIQDPEIRRDIVTLLIEDAEAYESTTLKNGANQTPKDLCEIYCPDDKEVARLASPPAQEVDSRNINQMLDSDDIVTDGSDDEVDSE